MVAILYTIIIIIICNLDISIWNLNGIYKFDAKDADLCIVFVMLTGNPHS